MSRFNIKQQIAVVISFLIMVMMGIGGVYFVSLLKEAKNAEIAGEFSQTADSIGALIHELQKERGTSSAFSASKGKEMADNLKSQRNLSTNKAEAAREALAKIAKIPEAEKISFHITKAQDALNKIADLRAEVDKLLIPPKDVIQNYTAIVFDLINLASKLALASGEIETAVQGIAYVNLIEAKERAGQERAVGAGAFAGGRFDHETYNRYAGLAAQQEAFFRSFRSLVGPSQIAQLNQALEQSSGRVNELRKQALESLTSGNLGGVKGEEWFAAATQRIDAIKKVEDQLVKDREALISSIKSQANSEALGLAFILSLVLIIAVILGWRMAFSIIRPLNEMGRVIAEVSANGSLHIRANIQGNCEIAQIAQAFNRMLQDVAAILDDISKVMGKMAEGDMQNRVTANALGDLAEVKSNINASIDTITTTLSGVIHNIVEIGGAVSEASRAIGKVSHGAQEQHDSLRELANAMESSQAAVDEVVRSVKEASHSTSEANGLTLEGVARMTQMLGLAENVASNSHKITAFNTTIKTIASQTNMLSLNAAIEAARAGDAGKGFAVVAEEVGKLASSSVNSAQEIERLVDIAKEGAEKSVESAHRASTDMSKIRESIGRLDDMISSVSAAVTQQSAAIGDINRNLGQIAQVGETNAMIAEEINATMVELARIAGDTKEKVNRFKLGEKKIVRDDTDIDLEGFCANCSPTELRNLAVAVDKAVAAHGAWKQRLRTAIDTGQSDASPATVRQDNKCAFGQWLFGGEIPAGFKNGNAYQKIVEQHARFHKLAGEILEFALAGQKNKAEAMMGISGEFAMISASLIQLLKKVQYAAQNKA